MPCLEAFGLTLESESNESAALRFLKNDGTSIVVQARCNQNGTIQDFVLKATPFSIHRQSSAMTAVENLLAKNDHHIVVPARRLTASGKDIHIATGFSGAEKTVWSVTTFEANAPSFDWLQSPPPWTDSHSYSAGNLLARTHAATRSVKTRLLDLGCEIETSIASSVPQLLLDACADAGSKYLARIGLESLEHQRLLAILRKAAAEIEDGIHAKALKAEEVVVHGDFQPGNILYRNGNACGLIDWDYTRLDNPLMDLAYGLLMYAGNLSSQEPAPFDTNLSCKFLQGYVDQIAEVGHEPVCLPDCYFTPSARDNRVFSNYMKLSAALIMLWSLSVHGQKHSCGIAVGRRTLQLLQEL